MITYKLIYTNKESAIEDLLKKGVLILEENNLILGSTIHSIVYIGKTYLDETTLDENYCVDIMTSNEIDFNNQVFPNNSIHKFNGQ